MDRDEQHCQPKGSLLCSSRTKNFDALSGWQHYIHVIRLRLPSCGRGLESQAQHLSVYLVENYAINWIVKRAKIKTGWDSPI